MKILVIDDEPVIADTLVDILKGEGHDAMAISDGASAISWASRLRPDVVISDVIMPGINGIDTAKAILGILPDCRIILFSGQSTTIDLLDSARRDGFNFEILAKPINPEVLLTVLHRDRSVAIKED